MAIGPTKAHFVCRKATRDGYTQTGNVFTTHAWRVSDHVARGLKRVHLHDTKDDTSWAQGRVVGWRRVDHPKGPRIEFDVEVDDVTDVWPTGKGGRGPEKAYV